MQGEAAPIVLTCGRNQQVRQLAANELRKRVWYKDGKMWGTVPQEFKARIKQGLLERCLVEPV
jgi:hypothetical protein